MLAPGFNRWGQVLLHFGTANGLASRLESRIPMKSGESLRRPRRLPVLRMAINPLLVVAPARDACRSLNLHYGTGF